MRYDKYIYELKMEQKCKNSYPGEAEDSPSSNTRSKLAEPIASPNLSNVTPKKSKEPAKQNKTINRTPVSAGSSSSKSGRTKLSEIRAAALKQKREEIAKGSTTPQQAIFDPDATARNAKHIVRGETGLITSELMERHYCPWDDNHIERPERLTYIRERFNQLDLIQRCKQLSSKRASDEELALFHSEAHIKMLKDLVEGNINDIKSECCKNDIYVNNDSLEAARLAAGSAIELTKNIISGKIQNGMCVIRPPGHHAMKSKPNGFCLCNNVGIAAKFALSDVSKEMCKANQIQNSNDGPSSSETEELCLNRNRLVRKILIVDFDVHHGQGTQYAFYDDPNVLYFSIHRYENGKFWPNLRESDFDSVGAGKGVGYNANLPLNNVGMSDFDYMSIVHQILLPVAYEFQPDIVLVEAGYDAAIGDPEGEMRLSPAAYGHIIHSLMALAGGRVGVFLEGGYFLESLAEGATMTLRALLGDFNISLGPPKPLQDSLIISVLNLKYALKTFWKNLNIHVESKKNDQNTHDFKHNTMELNETQQLHIPCVHYKEVTLRTTNWATGVYDPNDHYHQHLPEVLEFFTDEIKGLRQYYNRLIERHNILKPKKLALAFDFRMKAHYNTEENDHPERPQRIAQIFQTHVDYGIMARDEQVIHVQSRRATKEDICLAHDESHWTRMSELPDLPQHELNGYADSLDSIYLNPATFDCALLSAGNVLAVVDAVCNDEAQKGVAIVRPPGHHAEQDTACGFCIFNNAAVAAKYACKSHDLKRVLIVDWDVHHGNGIQNIFYESSSVLYISIHRYDNGTFFPGRPDAGVDFVGSGKGEGFNVNIPWNGSGMGDTEYALAFFNLVLPIAYDFNPELVLVSAGFDAARGDPLGKCKVSPEMYAHMTHHLSSLSNGKIILILEGGYNLNAISLSMTLCTKALLGDPLPPLAPYKTPITSAVHTIQKVIDKHSNYWPFVKSYNYCLPMNKEIEIRWESDQFSEQVQNQKEKSDSSDYIPELLIANSIICPNRTDIVEKDGGLLKLREYIPLQIASSVSVPGINTVSDHIHVKCTQTSDTVVDSVVYEKMKKPHVSSEIINIPTNLEKQLERMSIRVSQEHAMSMPEITNLSKFHSVDSQSGSQTAHLNEEYIPFQFGSYQESSSVYTITESGLSEHKNEQTKTTDSLRQNVNTDHDYTTPR